MSLAVDTPLPVQLLAVVDRDGFIFPGLGLSLYKSIHTHSSPSNPDGWEFRWPRVVHFVSGHDHEHNWLTGDYSVPVSTMTP